MIADDFRNGGPVEAVKICGLRRPEDAVAAVIAGADLIGFIFASTRRQVSAECAAASIAAAREAASSRGVLAVGVFVDALPSTINQTATAAGLDIVQLHGDESPATIAAIDLPVIKAIRPRPDDAMEAIDGLIEGFENAAKKPIVYLVDGYHPRHHGGQGIRADWALAREVSRRWPLMLAGGLDASNVGNAIESVLPRGIDVSSGVESDGEKDPEKIAAFIAAARAGFLQAKVSMSP